jgi:hypothetical protein
MVKWRSFANYLYKASFAQFLQVFDESFESLFCEIDDLLHLRTMTPSSPLAINALSSTENVRVAVILMD